MAEKRLVSPEIAKLALDAAVRQLFETSWGKARSWIETGKVSVDGKVVLDTRAPVAAGATIALNMNSPRPGARTETPALERERIVYLDTQLVVVDKPPGISTVPFEKDERGTLIDRVCAQIRQPRLEVVHRIDKETSGLLVFARTKDAAKGLANQFRFHTVHRRYLALVHGRVESQTIRSMLLDDRGDGLRGTAPRGWRVAPGQGQEAITHVRALEALDGATLIECELETGRNHQIRIHLSELGHPLLGEKLYVRDYRGEVLPAPRVMLHAAELGFKHPVSGAAMKWEKQAPEDFTGVLESRRTFS